MLKRKGIDIWKWKRGHRTRKDIKIVTRNHKDYVREAKIQNKLRVAVNVQINREEFFQSVRNKKKDKMLLQGTRSKSVMF